MILKILLIISLAILSQASEIKKIEFNNLYFLSHSTAKELITIKEGDEIDEEAIDTSIKELFKQGYFQDIWVERNGDKLIFNFKEKPSIAKLDIKGYKNNQEEIDEFLKSAGIKKGDMYDEAKISSVKDKFLTALNLEGKLDSIVEVEVVPINANSVEVVFVVNQGEEVIIDKLKLSGNKFLSFNEVEDILINKEKDDYIGWLMGFNSGELNIEQLKYDSARLKDYYLSKGFLDANVNTPLVRVDFNDYSASMSMLIDEGKQYLTSYVGVDYGIDDDIIDITQLEKDLKLKEETIFNVQYLREDLKYIKTKIANKGYAFVKVYPDVQQNKENATVDVTYKIVLGKKVYINDVIISGNSSTIDRIIRREIFLASGDLYNLTDLNDSKNALGRTGYFKGSSIKERRVSEDKIDLIVEVKEAPTGNIMVGGGYGSYDGWLANASISDRNIFGGGLNISLNVDKSQRSQKYSTSLFNPRINDSSYSAGFNLFWNNYDSYEETTYTNESKGGYINFGKILNRYIKSSLSINYVTTVIRDEVNVSANDNYKKISLSPSLVFNNTDDYYVPRRGFYITTSYEYAPKFFDADADFAKSYSSFQTFYGVRDYINYDLIFRYKLRYGYINNMGNTPTSERFFMGGVRNVRGYRYSSIKPTSTAEDGSIIYGGLHTFSQSFEASIPLVESARMRLAFFYDKGMIGNDKINEKEVAGYGAVIEWFAPIGPINFVFSRALSEDYMQYESQFEFTIGQKF